MMVGARPQKGGEAKEQSSFGGLGVDLTKRLASSPPIFAPPAPYSHRTR